MTAAVDKALPRVPIVKSAFLLGSIAPDIPLYLLSFGSVAYYRWARGWEIDDIFRLMFDDLYFNNPFWLASHNLLHSPTLLLIALASLWRSRRNIGSPSRWLFWFLLACLGHTTVDILTHVDDGPLLFFPFEWTARFHSRISYWDSQYYGREFQRFEQTLDVVLLVYLFSPRIYQCVRSKLRSYLSNAG